MPIGGKDAFLSKVTFRRESKWYSKTKQELKDMATIEERANLAAWQIYEETILSEHSVDRVAEIIAEKIHEQKAIDEAIRLKKCDDMTEAEYNREVAFLDWFYENSGGTITHSDAIEWARKETIAKACKWFTDYLMEIGYPDDWMRDSPNMESGKERFIKAMEE